MRTTDEAALTIPTLAEVRAAAARIKPYANRTPVLTCGAVDARAGCRVFMKCENLQKVGAFKFRGACNAVFALPEEKARRGVVCHSSGNHAQALALAARLRGIEAYIVMPSNAPAVKKAAVAGYGGKITYCEPTLRAREETQARIIAETGATEVHPYNNPFIIAGQGTATMELIEEIPDLDAVIAPVGGGGLLSGTAIAATGIRPGIRVIAAEPERADDAARSIAAGHIVPSENPKTVADGLLTSLGTLTFAVIREKVERIVTVPEEAIIDAMRFVWERAKIVIESSAGVGFAALWAHAGTALDPGLAGKKVGVIVCGGNVDLDRLPWQTG
jgi:threonine dehydratase